MMMLPTGPRERSAEELNRSRLGGGFRSYGSRFGDSGERRGGGFDDDGRRGPPGRASDLDMPSRANEDGNWLLNNKSFSSSPTDSTPRNRYGSLGGGADAPVDRADDDGDWSPGKKPLPSRYPSLGSGGDFRHSPGATDQDRWSRAVPHNGERERPRLVLDPPKRESSPLSWVKVAAAMAMDKVDAKEREKVEAVRKALRKQAPLSAKQELYCNDACVERFLRARGESVKKAAKHLRVVLSWRETIGAGAPKPPPSIPAPYHLYSRVV